MLLAFNKKLGRSRSAYRLRPTLNGQARGEGERMAVRHDKCRAPSLFLLRDLWQASLFAALPNLPPDHDSVTGGRLWNQARR